MARSSGVSASITRELRLGEGSESTTSRGYSAAQAVAAMAEGGAALAMATDLPDELLPWLRAAGVEWDDESTRVERCPRTGARAIRCVSPIRRGQLLARIPKAACVTRLTASAPTRALLERAEHNRAAAPGALRCVPGRSTHPLRTLPPL
jgi:hypothetical protein